MANQCGRVQRIPDDYLWKRLPTQAEHLIATPVVPRKVIAGRRVYQIPRSKHCEG